MAPDGFTAYFTNGPTGRLVDDAGVLSDVLWPAFRRVITSHSRTDPVVIDWWLFSPQHIAAEALDGVASVWLHIDAAALWRRERTNTNFTAGSSDPEMMLANFMHRSIWRNDLIEREARAAGLPLLHQPGTVEIDALVRAAREALAIDER